MKALVGAFNQEKALVGAFSVIVQPVVEPMDRFTTLVRRLLEEVSLEMVAVHQDEVEMVLQMELLVTPALLPAFSPPITTHLYFDEDTGGTQKIFRWGH